MTEWVAVFLFVSNGIRMQIRAELLCSIDIYSIEDYTMSIKGGPHSPIETLFLRILTSSEEESTPLKKIPSSEDFQALEEIQAQIPLKHQASQRK
jgi:hypothetical protein